MSSSSILTLPPLSAPSLSSHRILKNQGNAFCITLNRSGNPWLRMQTRRFVVTSRASTSSLPPFKFFEPPAVEENPFPPEVEFADPDFYRIGFVRSMRAYGVQFMEGPNGFGVYASKDVEPRKRARVIMEIPLELMLTISQKLPWMFFPDIIPIGHPIFDIINSTKPETDWDLRLACLLLYAFDVEGNFWQLYGDFLPSAEECTSLLLAHKDDLLELQDLDLAAKMEEQRKRAVEFWEKHWHSAVPLKIKRLAHDSERFLWALSIVQSRAINMQIRIGALVQDANMLVPYADMLNHSFQPNCFLHWRFKDRMLEVMINAGQRIRKGEEMTINYMSGQKNNTFMERYGFSSPASSYFCGYVDTNKGNIGQRGQHVTRKVVKQTGQVANVVGSAVSALFYKKQRYIRKAIAKCNSSTCYDFWPKERMRNCEYWNYVAVESENLFHAFNISGLPEEFYHNTMLSSVEDANFVDGAVIAAARALPTWSDGDVPPVPSIERKSARELQEDCNQLLAEFPTTIEQDQQILETNPDASRTREAAIKYRLHRKQFLKKVIQALELYQERILF